jgi:hypothetical protein
MNRWDVEPFWQWWTAMMADAPVAASAEPLTGLISAVVAEREAIRQLEKRVRRRQRWLDRHTGKGYLWA